MRRDERSPNQVDCGRFGAFSDRGASEELEGLVPVIIESLQAGAHRADLPERLATTQEGVCAQESGADRALHGGIRPNVGRLSRRMSLGIVDPQSFAVGVIAGVAATGLFVGFAALLVVGTVNVTRLPRTTFAPRRGL
jgi:hypothetical protein